MEFSIFNILIMCETWKYRVILKRKETLKKKPKYILNNATANLVPSSQLRRCHYYRLLPILLFCIFMHIYEYSKYIFIVFTVLCTCFL